MIDRWGSLTAADVAALDAAAGSLGVPTATLMEIAGFQLARRAQALATERGLARIVVIAGSGNNGGDGLVAARYLCGWGWPVAAHVVATAERWRLAPLGTALERLGVAVVSDASGRHAIGALEAADGLVIDALLGTGLSSAPRPQQAAVIEAMTASAVLSVDVPSGLDATTGEAAASTVSAASTCTFGAMKKGLWTASGRQHGGDIWVADIGIPTAAWEQLGRAQPSAVRGGELLPVSSDT